MADTPKYAVKTVDAFKNFEPHYCGDNQRAIPDTLYFLGTDGDGYQKYDKNFAPMAKDVSANEGTTDPCFTYDQKPIIGCRKGSLVKAGGTSHVVDEMGTSRLDVKIWREKVGDKWVCKYQKGNNAAKTIQIDNISRLGVLLVGAGGSGGKVVDKRVNCDGCDKKNFNISVPGSGGGGGGCIWCILDLDKTTSANNYFLIQTGQGGQNQGSGGGNTSLYYQPSTGNKKLLLRANGGSGGNGGDYNGVSNVNGGGSYREPGYGDYVYWNTAWEKQGGYGPGYSDSESRSAITHTVRVAFLGWEIDSEYVTSKTNPELFGFGTRAAITEQREQKSQLAVPGGNSWGTGGKCNNNGQFYRGQPSMGGGGMSYGIHSDATYSTDKIMRNNWSSYIQYIDPSKRSGSTWNNYSQELKNAIIDFVENAVPCIRGADGYWVLFY